MGAKLLYDQDFVEWTRCAAKALREGRLEQPDLDFVAEEIEDMGKRDQRAVENNLRVIIYNLLKWRFQPGKRTAAWRRSIVEHRGRLELLLRDSPSLENLVISRLEDIYKKAVRNARAETGLESFPEQCPWTFDETIRPEFFPE